MQYEMFEKATPVKRSRTERERAVARFHIRQMRKIVGYTRKGE